MTRVSPMRASGLPPFDQGPEPNGHFIIGDQREKWDSTERSCQHRLSHLAVLVALWPMLGCQPSMQVGLVSAPALSNTTPPFRPYDVIANGYETCPADGTDDPLPGRYPPCPAPPAAQRLRVVTIH